MCTSAVALDFVIVPERSKTHQGRLLQINCKCDLPWTDNYSWLFEFLIHSKKPHSAATLDTHCRTGGGPLTDDLRCSCNWVRACAYICSLKWHIALYLAILQILTHNKQVNARCDGISPAHKHTLLFLSGHCIDFSLTWTRTSEITFYLIRTRLRSPWGLEKVPMR